MKQRTQFIRIYNTFTIFFFVFQFLISALKYKKKKKRKQRMKIKKEKFARTNQLWRIKTFNSDTIYI